MVALQEGDLLVVLRQRKFKVTQSEVGLLSSLNFDEILLECWCGSVYIYYLRVISSDGRFHFLNWNSLFLAFGAFYMRVLVCVCVGGGRGGAVE